jgi:hypothetical protein
MPANHIEYKTLPWKVEDGYLDDQSLDSVLHRLGAEGWMLVSVSPILTNGNTTQLIHHLYRSHEPERKAGFPVGETAE